LIFSIFRPTTNTQTLTQHQGMCAAFDIGLLLCVVQAAHGLAEACRLGLCLLTLLHRLLRRYRKEPVSHGSA